MLKHISVIFLVLLLSGCAGLGSHKRLELIPDEVSISIDSNPQKDWEVDEVTGGMKWKLK